MNYTELKLEIDGNQVGGIEFGDSSKPLLLSLHGWLDNAASFLALLPYLKDHFRVLAIDLPGHGNSGHISKEAHYHMLDSIYFIEQLRLKFAIEKINFLSHSLGGVLSGLYAGVYPENVKQIFSVEALGPITNPSNLTTETLRKHIERRKLLSTKKRKFHSSLESCIEARTRDGLLNAPEARILVERAVIHSENGYSWKSDPRMTLPSSFRLNEEQCEDILSNIKCPYHLIEASEGISILKSAKKSRMACVQNIVLHQINGGHHVHMENPEAVSKIVIENFT